MARGKRGFLSEDLRIYAKAQLGRDFTQDELRLYPYLVYVAINGGEIQLAKISAHEKGILATLQNEGHIKNLGDGYYMPTREFYMFMNDCLYEAYVDTIEASSFDNSGSPNNDENTPETRGEIVW